MLKKFIIFILSFCVCFSTGCAKKSTLLPHISELRLNIYEGESQDYSLKATFGFCEKLKNLDGIVGEKEYNLTLTLKDCNYEEKITATIDLGEQNYTEQFFYDPVSSKMTTNFPVNDMPNDFDVTITANGQSQKIIMRSVVPENTVTYQTALNSFEKQQSPLLENYKIDGEFKGEIAMRIIVRNGSPYWYLGLTDENGKTKALLIDGFSCEILAVKDIF